MNRSTWRLLLPPLGLMVFSFALSSIPGDMHNQTNFLGFVPPALQNLLHVPLFALLAWLWLRSFTRLGQPLYRAVLLAILVSVTWGVLDEIHQYYIPGRFASLTDMALNTAGVVIGIATAHFRNKPKLSA